MERLYQNKIRVCDLHVPYVVNRALEKLEGLSIVKAVPRAVATETAENVSTKASSFAADA